MQRRLGLSKGVTRWLVIGVGAVAALLALGIGLAGSWSASVARSAGILPAQIALAWALRNPQVTAGAIAAASTRELILAAGTLLSPE